jgi:Nucleotidyl transferase AbiEii toxin, Type IV TA system
LGAEASSVVEPEIAPVAITLERVQLEGLEQLPFMPLRYQIAQKLHACSEPSTDEHPNGRARDLVDLDLIEELSVTEDDLPSIRDACVEIFESRQKHGPPKIVAAPGWDQLERRPYPPPRQKLWQVRGGLIGWVGLEGACSPADVGY